MLKSSLVAKVLPGLAVCGVLIASFIASPAGLLFGSLSGYGYGACGYGVNYTGSPVITGVFPNEGPTTGGTAVTVTGSGFCNSLTAVQFGTTGSLPNVVSDTQLTTVSPLHSAGTVDVTVTNAGGTSPTTPADLFTFVPSSCSTSQFTLTGNNGSTWVDMSAGTLSVIFTPTVDSFAILNGNADLWTSTAGFNQDLGIAMTGGAYPSVVGQPEAWKESGGFGGTFSPNAANAQTVLGVLSGVTYTARLQWKANHSDPGTIYAGAGPIGGRFSPTCLTVRLIPVSSATVVTASSTAQYSLTGNNGSTWADISTANLSVTYTAPADGFLVLAGNADLWTANAGFNQDIAINLDSSIAAWKESGGGNGTFSPNAAFVLDVVQVASGTAHTAKLQWKANHSDPGTIYAGAGPIGAKFSPTSISLLFLPSGSAPVDEVSTTQYTFTGSNGSTWQTVDLFTLTISFTPTSDCQAFLSGNADLWTANAGFNQDLGISVIDTSFPSVPSQPEAWKESGGFNGTFSPNAAYVQSVVSFIAGHTYTVQLIWKAQQNDPGTIYAGAGPISGAFSPTRLTLQPIGC